ncbi:MAG: type II toxin-antitoxin system prevent-host-death family antitoxin [Treponema sp.]|nr:type II toxin-antitoxin system prevent-host-death family antitoxin [Treponema sp.]
MCRTSIYEARNNFSNLVKLAESGEPVELTRYDKPVAVIISYEEYEKREEKPSLIEKLELLKKEYADVLDNEGIPLPKKVYPDPNRVIFEE